MVSRSGKSDKRGSMAMGRSQGGMVLGRATTVLTTYRPVLDEIAELLVEKEMVDGLAPYV